MKRLLLAFLALSTSCSASATGFVPASEAFDVFLASQNDRVALVINVMPGFALYREKLKVTGDGVTITGMQVPHGDVVDDPELGPSEHLGGEVVIPLSTAKSRSPSPHIVVKFQGCKEGDYCYPPQTRVLPLVIQ